MENKKMSPDMFLGKFNAFLKLRVLKWIINNEMKVVQLTDQSIEAASKDLILFIETSHLLQLINNGWEVEEVLDNELCGRFENE